MNHIMITFVVLFSINVNIASYPSGFLPVIKISSMTLGNIVIFIYLYLFIL